MKTFTTYAEKKAKQILNLLQGYTKGIRITAILMLLLMGVNNAWGAYYILGPDGSWDQNATHQMVSSGITNWVYKNLTPSGQWTSFKVYDKDGNKWYGKDSNGNNVAVGVEYTPTTSGGDNYCDFTTNYKNMSYYFFFNTSTKKLMVQPNYYLVGTCGASNQNWGQTQNETTYDATKGYFKWNTCTLTANTEYKFKLSGYGAWTYKYEDWNGVTIVNGTKLATDNDKNIRFKSTYAGTTVITFNPVTNEMVINCPSQISYNKGANGTGSISSGIKTYGINFTLSSSTFTRTGYTQDGWSTTDGGNKVYDLGGTYTTDKSITLYPHWTANKYTVTLNNQSATTAGTSSVQATYGSAMPSATMPQKTGYNFGGYYTAINGGGTKYYNANGSSAKNWDKTAATTLYAKWTIINYDITYNLDGGTNHANNPTSYTVESGEITLQNPTKTGYTFEGWYTEAEFTNKVTKIAAGSTGDKTFYAKWTEILSTITITTNPAEGGNVTVDDEPFTPGYTVQVGVATSKKVTAKPNAGYGVAAWTVSNKDIVKASGGETVTLTADGSGREGTLCANFVGLEYTITFNKQEGTGGTDKVTVQYNNNNYSKNPVEAPKREGYAFGGYYSLAGGNGIQVVDENGKWITKATGYTDADRKWVKADNVTLYAKWTESQAKHDVRVLYMCGDVVVKEAETIAVGEILPTSITAPAVTGYTFSEWKLGDGLVTENNLTAYTINLKTKSSGDYTLTANYIKYQYTLTFGVLGYGGSVSAIADGNEIASPAPLGQDSKVTLTATAKDGYVFHKWINSTGNEVSKANPYEHTMTESTTINAVFMNTRMLYLKLNDKWSRELDKGVWFAAYFFNTSNENYWVKMSTEKACEKNGCYKTPIPEGNWTNVIFVRMNKDNQTWLSFENKWDKTIDLTIPKDGKNLFTLYNDHEGENCNGTWSAHTSTYEPVYLTYNVEVPAGTPNCYISGEMNGWSFTEMEKVDDTHYTITIQDACSNDEYKYCYGPSWDCQEVKKSDFTAIDNRKHSTDDKVEAWIKYCLVGNNNIGWSWNDAYSFDIAGDMSHNFNANYYDIKVMSSIGEYYTHNEHTYELHRSHTSVNIPHEGGTGNQLILKADLAGTYKFHFDPVSKLLTIEFPEKGYRLKIRMEDGTVYTSNAVDNATETLSFFAPGSDDTELNGTITLEHKGETISSFTAPYITESGVYTAKLNSDRNGITEIALYNGNYYIRTDGASGGWGNYTDNGNKMTYFVPREEEKYSYYWVEALPRASRNESNGVVNVKACVANEYNDNLAVMLGGDKFTSDSDGNVKIIDPDEHHREKINVRFGYNPKTNHFERAMLTGSGNINTFLNIFDPLPEGYLYKTYKQETFETQLTAASQDNKFTDISNWVYERDIWVDVQEKEDVTVCLTAVSYNGARNSLFGFEDPEQTTPKQRTIVAKGSTPGPKKMRVIYDFKTNRMIMAWMPGKYECNGEEALIADVLFMRHENELVPQLTMKDNNPSDSKTPKIAGIQSQFFALEFENNGENNREEQYWFTLPFNSIVGSISGVPGYMTVWGIQRYDGAERAQKGWFKETETFWKWLTPNDTLKAGEGYVLSFDKSKATWNTFDVHTENEDGSVTTTQRSLLRLYFPSIAKGFTFTGQDSIVEYANEPCTIQREDRYKQDGNWKIIGPISYNTARPDSTTYETSKDSVWHPKNYTWSRPMFRYSYWRNPDNRDKWKYTPEDGEKAVYNAFFGYMVQFAGFINWSEISQSIHPRLRARTYTDQVPTNITTNLELLDAEGVQQDQTFVALNIEGTTTYDLNKDLNKVFNKNFANIYTLSEGIPFAGNTLPMEKAIVPVGVRIATAGEYTFRMPDGTEGINVTLIDNQTGTQTDMLMSEYTVTLDAGTIENRFYLVVDPDRTATSVENVGTGANNDEAKDQIKKFLIDGKLFIRTADGIFDAKGQRL